MIIASRGSRLSLRQDEIVSEKLQEEGISTEVQVIHTRGDLDQSRALKEIGGSGLFIREIEEVLARKQAEIAVHSAKDLPYDLREGMVIGAVMPAADPADLLVMRKDRPLVIGTGSARREAELRRLFPNAKIKGLRGNVETRLQKLKDGEYDAIVIAKAGIDRLGISLTSFRVKKMSAEEMVPACGQGIIAMECREDDKKTREILAHINDEATMKRFLPERYLFGLLRADCSMPVGAHAVIDGDRITLYALYLTKKEKISGYYKDYQELCKRLADRVMRF
jgi:hydroxymethylbilane synthase